MNGRFVAYYRVSSAKQGRSGLGLEAQQHAVRAYLDGGRWSLLAEFTEVESGKSKDRPQLLAAISAARKAKAKLVIAKLDRLARNAAFLLTLRDSGIEFIAADMPDANKLTVGIMALIAEDEADRISARTKAALAAAKRRGVQLGSPDPLKGAAIGARKVAQQATQRAQNVAPIIAEVKKAGVITLQGIANALNARGIKTARDGDWHPMAVSRILSRVS